jgi:hypothetical protein
MRGDRASQGVARMRGNSARKKRKPCHAATPRSNRKARHTNLFRIASSLRADMIFGNDRSTMNIPSEYRIASIGSNHAMILPYYANPKADGIFEQDRALIGYSICRLSDTASEIKNSNGSSFGNLWHRMREKLAGARLACAK